MSTLPRDLTSAAAAIWKLQAKTQTVSDTQRTVLSCLEGMRLNPKLEAMTEDGCFSIDVAVGYKGQKVAVEVMGMEHYAANPQYIGDKGLVGSSGNGRSSTSSSGKSSRKSNSSSGFLKQVTEQGYQEEQQQKQQKKYGVGNSAQWSEGITPGQQQQEQQLEGEGKGGNEVPYLLLLGPDCFRTQLVEARGWKVLPVSYVEVAQAEALGFKALEDLLWQGLEGVTREKGNAVLVGRRGRRGGRGGGRGGRGRGQQQQGLEGELVDGEEGKIAASEVGRRVVLTRSVPQTVLDSLSSSSLRGKGPAAAHVVKKRVGARSFDVGSMDWVSQQVKGLEQLALQEEYDAAEFDLEYVDEGLAGAAEGSRSGEEE